MAARAPRGQVPARHSHLIRLHSRQSRRRRNQSSCVASQPKALLHQRMLVPSIRLLLRRLVVSTYFRPPCYSQPGQRRQLYRLQHLWLPQPQCLVHKAHTALGNLGATPLLPLRQGHQCQRHMRRRHDVLPEICCSQAHSQIIRPTRSLLPTRLPLQPARFQQPGSAPL